MWNYECVYFWHSHGTRVKRNERKGVNYRDGHVTLLPSTYSQLVRRK